MRYPFVYEIRVCGRCVQEVEGVAIIGARDGHNWTIEEIIVHLLEPTTDGRMELELPRDHMLWAGIMLHLLSLAESNEIEDAWRKESFENAIEARRMLVALS